MGLNISNKLEFPGNIILFINNNEKILMKKISELAFVAMFKVALTTSCANKK